MLFMSEFCWLMPNDIMFKIVDTEHLHAELTLFEKDLLLVKIGQKVQFTLSSEIKERFATVHLIGKEIANDRTVQIHCHLDQEDTELIPGMYLKAYIETNRHSVLTVPENAVVDFEGKDYIFVNEVAHEPEMRLFKMIQVKKCINDSGFLEIESLHEFKEDAKLVIKGAYDILAALKNSEESGGHAH